MFGVEEAGQLCPMAAVKMDTLSDPNNFGYNLAAVEIKRDREAATRGNYSMYENMWSSRQKCSRSCPSEGGFSL